MKINVNTIVIDRGMALHKMIRLLTFSLGGEVIFLIISFHL